MRPSWSCRTQLPPNKHSQHSCDPSACPLQPANVFIDEGGGAKLSDLGLSRARVHTVLETRTKAAGTPGAANTQLIAAAHPSPATSPSLPTRQGHCMLTLAPLQFVRPGCHHGPRTPVSEGLAHPAHCPRLMQATKLPSASAS